jgi:hypothetical protein
MISVQRHKDLHHQNATRSVWSSREAWFVDRIPDGAAVLDIGAGAMHLLASLRQAKKSRVKYMAVDAVERGADAHVRLCNLNLHEYPLHVTPQPTHIVLQGVLEYLYDKVLLLRSLRCAYPRATMLLSYNAGHRVGQFEAHGWVAPLTLGQLNETFETLGLDTMEKVNNCAGLRGQRCLVLKLRPLRTLHPIVCGEGMLFSGSL